MIVVGSRPSATALKRNEPTWAMTVTSGRVGVIPKRVGLIALSG
jgi:hypothetical protein